MFTAEDLGIREVDTAEALAVAGLTHARHAAGEEVPWDPGLFLLDVESGEVEAWVSSLAAVPEEESHWDLRGHYALAVSPGNRFVSWARHEVLYDRHTGRTYAWDRSRAEFERWWGTGAGERLLFRLAGSDAVVVVNADMRPVARLALPRGELLSDGGRRSVYTGTGYILVVELGEDEPGDRIHILDLEDEADPTIRSWTLPWKTIRRPKLELPYRIDLLDELVAVVAEAGPGTCRVVRYGLTGSLLSDTTIPCWRPMEGYWMGAGLPRLSPDGRLVAGPTSGTWDDPDRPLVPYIPFATVISVFDAATGEESARIKGVSAPRGLVELTGMWLADSSGIIVRTRHGRRTATLGGEWQPDPGRPAPDDPDRFLSDYLSIGGQPEGSEGQPGVVNRRGEVEARLAFGAPSAPVRYPGYDDSIFLDTRGSWGATSDTLRVRTTIWPYIEDYTYPPPLLAPVIELPPFDDRLLVEVVVDTCLNLRRDQSHDAPIIACIPSGTVAEADGMSYSRDLRAVAHLRTDDGREGWASAEYLRWHSDGVWLDAASTSLRAGPGISERHRRGAGRDHQVAEAARVRRLLVGGIAAIVAARLDGTLHRVPRTVNYYDGPGASRRAPGMSRGDATRRRGSTRRSTRPRVHAPSYRSAGADAESGANTCKPIAVWVALEAAAGAILLRQREDGRASAGRSAWRGPTPG